MASDPNNLSLPAELLLEIFEEAAQDEDIDVAAKNTFLLARVCSRWRSILLHYGSTWSTLSLATSNVTDLMLQRSKSAPLTFRVDLGTKKRRTGYDAAVARDALERALGRIQELVLIDGGDLNINRNILRSLACGPVTSLTTLELVSHERGNQPAFRIEPTFLAGAFHLRRLTLHDTELLNGVGDQLPGLCQPLFHLELKVVCGLSLPTLLGMLGAARLSLKTLELNSLQLANAPGVQPTETLDLRALKKLSLLGIKTPLASSPVAILPFIEHPSAVRLTVHVHATAGTLHALNNEIALWAHLRSLAYDFRSALIGSVGEGRYAGLRLRCWASSATPDIYNLDQRSAAPLDLRVTNTMSTSRRAAASILAALSKAANISTVWRAAVAPSADKQAWARVLCNASGLYELSVHGAGNLDNLRVARTTKANNPVSENDLYLYAEMSSQSSLKKLRMLNVYGINLSGSTVCHGDKRMLIDVLKTLSDLDELCICYSNMHKVDRLDIAPFVNHGHIVWDGAEHGLEQLPDVDSDIS